jgi:indole-3-glycerol phosphate synthase
MHQQLAEILTVKKKEVARLKKAMPAETGRDLPPIRDFKAAISAPRCINLIAEIKFASPSAGSIRPKADPIPIGKMYQDAGAAAISFLTDKRFFQGDISELPRLKKAVSLPILRKDFILDPLQVQEAFEYGADAILLIVRILSPTQLIELSTASRELGMACLTEVHDEADLEIAVNAGSDIIGINNRNLDTFTVDINTTHRLASLVPDDRVRVSESGILGGGDVRVLLNAGIQAVLVGSSLMQSENPAEKAAEIVKAGENG